MQFTFIVLEKCSLCG